MSKRESFDEGSIHIAPVSSSGLRLNDAQRDAMQRTIHEQRNMAPVDIDSVLEHFGLPSAAVIRTDRNGDVVPYEGQLEQVIALIAAHTGEYVGNFNRHDGTVLVTPQQRISALLESIEVAANQARNPNLPTTLAGGRSEFHDRVVTTVAHSGDSDSNNAHRPNLQMQNAAMAALFGLMEDAAKNGAVNREQLELLREQLSFETLPPQKQQQYIAMLTLISSRKYSETLAQELRRVRQLMDAEPRS